MLFILLIKFGFAHVWFHGTMEPLRKTVIKQNSVVHMEPLFINLMLSSNASKEAKVSWRFANKVLDEVLAYGNVLERKKRAKKGKHLPG